MPDIVLKDRTGEPQTYAGVEQVKLNTADGGVQIFTAGEPEEKAVSLDFSAGDMEILPSEGKLLTKVGIAKPETLTPENVAEGVEIAGVTGTFAGGASAKKPYIEYTHNDAGEVIAAKMYGYTTIPSGCFAYAKSLESVDLSESPGITTIGYRAFQSCTSLKSFIIPETVTSIGEYAFYGAGLTSIVIPASCRCIGNYAFAQSSLADVTLSEGVVVIRPYAFRQCTKLTAIVFPSTLCTIGERAFDYCESTLTSMTFNTDNLWRGYSGETSTSVMCTLSLDKIAQGPAAVATFYFKNSKAYTYWMRKNGTRVNS